MATDSFISASLQPDPQSSPSNRPKSPPETSPNSPSSKGKAPMEDPSAPAESNSGDTQGGAFSLAPSCGICLSEEGHAVRGCIDSCDHYFCFLCIIEWSKIESRCPLCKQRFASIRRMRTDGTFIGDRAVSVPVRNQIYDPHRTMTSAPPDPYSNISCNICTGCSDENLMLLCDLCDTAVHTYCAGLGATIPEGDWFCQECAQMKAEELNCEPSSIFDNTEKLSIQPPPSIFDIVRAPGEPDPEAYRLRTLFSPQQQESLSPSDSFPHLVHRNVAGPSRRGSSTCMKSEIKVTESSVRTLNRCRDVNKYIRELRENWTALRSGSLSFPSRRFDSGASNNSRVNGTSRGDQSDGSLCGVTTTDKRSNDVDRAWKMFNMAKSKKPQKLSATSSLTSSNLSLKVSSSSKDSNNLFLGASCKTVPSKTKSNMYTGLKMQQSLKKQDGCGSKRPGQHVNGIVLGRENTTINHTGLEASASPGKCTFSSKNKDNNMDKLIKNAVFHARSAMSSQEKLGQGSLHGFREQALSSSTKSLPGSLKGASHAVCTNLQKKPSSLKFEGCSGPSGQNFISDNKHTEETESNQLQESAGKRRNAGNIGNGSKRIKVDIEAKSEIQSLVKLNLKLLSAGNKIEVEEFKRVARRSTHDILAACGLEPWKHDRSPIPKPNCSHDDQTKQQSKLSLMPSSCRECFYAFVKDVVSSVMSERISC